MKRSNLLLFIKNAITASALVSMLFQSVLPFTYAVPAYAQEVTPTDTTTPAPTQDQVTPTDTVTPTDAPTSTPTDTITPAPTQDQSTPTPTDAVSPTDTQAPTPTDSTTIIPTPDTTTPTTESNANVNSQGPPSSHKSSVTPTPQAPTPTVTPVDQTEDENGQVSSTVIKNVSAPSLDLNSTTSAGSASVTTDKGSYSPTDTAIISGSGFLPNKDYTLEVTSSDAPAVDFTTTITMNDQGSFVYAYQLDGNPRVNYSVNVKKGEHVVATTTFLDPSPSANLDQCANDPAPSPSTDGCNSSSSQWVNGNLGSSKSSYFEGDSIAYRMTFGSLSLSSHSVTIEWDTTKSGKHAIDYLTTFNRTVGNANPCLGVSGCSSSTTFSIPADPNVTGATPPVTPISGNFTMYGGTITGVSSYSLSGTYAGDSSTRITITFNASVANPVLAWGGHIATRNDWGATMAATAIPGSPYHTRLIDLDGSGGNQDRSLSADAVIFPASITIVKQATPESAQSFGFAASPSPLSNFSLVDDGTTANTKAFTNITNFQTYTVSESSLAGWTLNGISCSVTSANGGSQNTSGSTVTIDLKEGENVTCTYTNTRQAATLNIVKNTVGGNGTFSFTSSPSLTIAGITTVNGTGSTSATVTPNTPYTITETSQAGWSTSYSNCTNISVAAGQSATCTVTNTKLPTLTVNKVCDPSNDSGLFNLKIDSTVEKTDAACGGTTGAVVVSTGSHSVSETQGTGTNLSNYTATYGGDCATNGSITLAAGDNKVCTITNTLKRGTMIVKKVMVGGTDTFTFTGSPSGTISTNNGTITVNNVLPGQYTTTETPKSGWDLTSLSCDDGTNGGTASTVNQNAGSATFNVDPGETVTCTFTNTKLPTLKVIKAVVNNNGGTKQSSDFTVHVKSSGTDVTGSPAAGSSTGTTYTLPVGSYTVSENDPSSLGYTQTGISGDCATNGSITLAAGDNKTCTITNDDNAPSLTLTKHVSNTHGGQASATDFTLTATGPTTISGSGSATSGSTFSAGTYTLSESSLAGYQAGSWSCTGDVTNSGTSITLGLGQSASCQITNSDIAPTLKLVKDVTNDNGGTATPGAFTLTATGTNGFSDKGDSITFHTVNANTSYTLSESGPSGYTGGSWTCDNNVSATNGQITLGLSQNVICTITNNDTPPSLTLVKRVINDNGGTASASAWTLTATGPTTISGTTPVVSGATFSAGTYTLSESNGPSGYTASSWVCTGGTQNGNQITLANGQSATCTITNDDIAPQLTVIKHVINDNGGSLSANNFTMVVTGTNVSSPSFGGSESGTTVTLDQGTFSAGEIAAAGYASSFSGDCTGTINVGDSKTCTITNDDQPATLTVIKHVINDNGGTKVAGDFTMNVTATNASPSSFPGDESGTSVTLDAGSYSVDEGTHTGYTETIGRGCSGTIANGGTATCIITNDDIAPSLTLQKVVQNNNGGTAQNTDWTLTATGSGQSPTNLSGTTPVSSGSDFKADTYTLAESSGPSGYSASSWVCTGGTQKGNQITLANGESASCTITNSDVAPTLKLVKHVTNNNGGTAVAGDWNLTATGSSGFTDAGDSTTFHTVLANTSYDLSEAGPSEYTAGNWSCDGGSLKGSSVTLGLAENVTCSITNDDNAPSLTLVKFVDNQGVGTASASDFTLTATGPTTISGAGGAVSDSSFTAGTYTLSETNLPGYTASSWGCVGGTQNGSQITLGLGDSAICSITNTRDTGSVIVHKQVDTTGTGVFDGNDATANTLGFTWAVDDGNANAFGASVSGLTTLDTHEISESVNNQPYHFVGWYDNSGDGSCTNPDSTTLPADVSLANNGDSKTITLCNARDTGTVRVEKVLEDPNGNVITTDPTKFTFTVSQDDTSVDTAQIAGGQSQEFVVPTGDYDVTETPVAGYTLLGCSANYEEGEIGRGITNGETVSVFTDETVTVVCTNKQEIPVLTIAKTNNKLGIDQHPGDTVLYTMTVTATQAAAQNVTVTDLLPKGFTYQSGSWTANSDVRGDLKALGITTEPTYHSPGTWQLGNMSIGETVTLTLLATVGDVQPGDYKDVAWAQGNGVASGTVLALAQPEGFVDTNFVGTDVNVVNDKPIASFDSVHTQEVLGASTMADTGANVIWIDLAISLLILGFVSGMIGLTIRRKYHV